MRKQFVFCLAFPLAISLSAQEAKPVVLVEAKGKVALLGEGKTAPVPLEPGAVAKHTGQLQLQKNASAVLYCDGQFKTLSGGKNVPLSSVCNGEVGKRVVDADYDFGNKLMAAVEMVAVAQQRGDGWGTALGDKPKSGDGWGTALGDKPKSGDGWGTALGDKPKSGDGWGTALGDKPKSGDGWGGKGSTITLILPFGKVKAAKTAFSWSRPSGQEPFECLIYDESGAVVYQASTRDTFVWIDLTGLKLSPEKIYHWKVATRGAKALISNDLSFIVGSKTDWESTLQRSSASPLARSAQSPALRKLVQAVALENNEWFYAAQEVYTGLQRKKTNHLARVMHAAFWMRYGFHRLAEKAARGY